MSDGEAEGDVTDGNGDVAEAEDDGAPARGREVWIEKYRPERLEDVLGHDHITERLEEYVERNDIPHLLFAGPAGTGKCVTGETPVLTNRGVERMEDVVGETEGFSTPDEGLEVLTLDEDGEFRYVEPSHVFGKRTDDLVSVRTRDGADTTVTPEHKLLVLGDDGPNWKRAADLSPGERLARPRSVPLATGDSTLDWTTALDGERTLVRVTEEFAAEYGIPVEEDRPGRKKAGVVGFREGSDGGEIATTAGTTKTTVRTSRRQSADTDLDEPSAVCSLSDLRELDVHRDELKRHVTGIQYVSRDDERSRPITPPWSVTPALATFVGLAVSEARIDGGEITVVNGDERVLERFEETARELFDVDPERGENGGVPSVHVESGSLTHYLNACFDVFAGATGRDGIGSALVGADRESQSAFLRAVFDGAADVDSDEPVELTHENGDLITLLSYLLAGFGISTRRSTRSKAATNGSGRKREYHVLSLSGADNLSRFRDCVGFTVDRNAERVARNAARTLHPVTSADLYYDEVESVEREPGERRVYDLTVPGTRNYVAGRVPTVMHNTTCAVAIARELYGDDWQENFLELNASDERGIDVVRERIKNFARASFGGYDHRIIFLDEADALTSDAQAALRRTMEQYSNNTRFFLSCNYSSDIIDPIQSRCTVFRFSPLEDPAVAEQIRRIADEEDIEITEDGLEALVYVADGDMRKAINRLQAAAVMGETVDEDTVFEITSAVKPEEIRELVERALRGDFSQARSQLDDMLTGAGVAGGDVIDQIHRSVWEFDLADDEAVRLMERVGEADYRITAGANEQVQLEALLASLSLDEDD